MDRLGKQGVKNIVETATRFYHKSKGIMIFYKEERVKKYYF